MNQVRTKILFLITKAKWGGAQRYVFDLSTHLPKDSFDVVVAYGSDGTLAQDLTTAGISSLQLPSLGRDVAIVSDVKSFFEIVSVLRNERPDVVHLNSSKAAGLGALAARFVGIKKIVFTIHGLPEDESRDALSRFVIKFATRLTILLCTDVIVVSKNNFDRIRSSKVHLIYNGIEQNISFGSGGIIRSKFPSGVRITGTIGELTKNKNQIALVEQAKVDPNMYVAIVGEGEDRAMLERKIKEYGLVGRVKLLGFVPARDVLKGFDVFALPSTKEGLPYVLLEARLAGVPIVANRVGGVGEILDAKDLSEFSIERMLEKTIALY